MNLDSVKYNLGDIVYHKIRSEPKGIVTGILFRPEGVVYYVTFQSGGEFSHYDIELSAEPIYDVMNNND